VNPERRSDSANSVTNPSSDKTDTGIDQTKIVGIETRPPQPNLYARTKVAVSYECICIADSATELESQSTDGDTEAEAVL
jgi:hypothetical protein